MASSNDDANGAGQDLKLTALYDLHVELGARLVPFAGYSMPVQFPTGIITEHNHTRTAAGLFDVSHMGQATLKGPDYETVAKALESLTCGNFIALKPGRMRYSVLLNDSGGIIDDLMAIRPAETGRQKEIDLVVNAARKDVDYAHIRANLPDTVTLTTHDDRALVALQGPEAGKVLAQFAPDTAQMTFMTAMQISVAGHPCWVTRSGYTGEDGFEIATASSNAEGLTQTLLGHDDVEPIGLGARDSLRLEAGLCLYGHDVDETVSPFEANISFAVSKKRMDAGNIRAIDRLHAEQNGALKRIRVPLLLQGRAPAREGATIHDRNGAEIGVLTSGGFSPTLGQPIAMGFVPPAFADQGTPLTVSVRGKMLDATVSDFPFVPHRYHRIIKQA